MRDVLAGWSSPEAWTLARLACGKEEPLLAACADAAEAWSGDDPAMYLEALQEAVAPRLLDLWNGAMAHPVATSTLLEVGHWFAQTRSQTVTQAQLRDLASALWEGHE